MISPTASQGAIGGANVAPFLPAGEPPPGPAATGGTAGPVATMPKKLTAKALAGAKGVPIKVKVTRAGKVKLSGTVPAKVLRRKGKPVVVATGSAIAKRAGTVTVRLRLTAAATQEAEAPEGRADDAAREPGRPHSTKRITLR